jgi:hypothetical protein
MKKIRERYGIYLRKLRRDESSDDAQATAGIIASKSVIENYINDSENLATEILSKAKVRFVKDENGIEPQLQSADLTKKHVPQAIEVLMYCRLAREEMMSISGREALWRGIKLEQALDSLTEKLSPQSTSVKAKDKLPREKGNRSVQRAKAYVLRRDEFPDETKKASKMIVADGFGVGYKQIERDLRRRSRSSRRAS